MTITDLHARSRDTHQRIGAASRSPYSGVCMRVYTLYPWYVSRDAYVLTEIQSVRCKGESSKQRERARARASEREERTNERPGESKARRKRTEGIYKKVLSPYSPNPYPASDVRPSKTRNECNVHPALPLSPFHAVARYFSSIPLHFHPHFGREIFIFIVDRLEGTWRNLTTPLSFPSRQSVG